MSEAILTTSEMGKPDASCVVPTLGTVVAVPTDGYWNEPGIRIPGYPGFQMHESPSTSPSQSWSRPKRFKISKYIERDKAIF